MKRLLQSFISFTRTERLGLIGLCILLLLLIVVRFTMHLWMKPERPTAEEKQMLVKWQNYQRSRQMQREGEVTHAPAAVVNGSSHTAGQLFYFDPNTLDSAGFRLLGLGEKPTSNLLHWRAKGKKFYVKEDLKPLYDLAEEEYKRLAPYIRIELKKVDLNTADSADLVALKGIGPKLAHRILQRRREKGKFTSYEELKEVYAFPERTFSLLKQQLVIK